MLVNVNLVDKERAEKNVELRKKKPDYLPYAEDESVDDLAQVGRRRGAGAGHLGSAALRDWWLFSGQAGSQPVPLALQQKPRSILSKYDEELEGERPHSFRLEQGGVADGLRERELEEIRARLRLQAQSLSAVGPRLASEYLTPEEMVSSAAPTRTRPWAVVPCSCQNELRREVWSSSGALFLRRSRDWQPWGGAGAAVGVGRAGGPASELRLCPVAGPRRG